MRRKSIAFKSPGKKRIGSHRVKLRGKVRKKKFKRVSFGVTVVLLIAALGFSLKAVYGFVAGKVRGGVFDSEIKSLSVDIDNDVVKDDILGMLGSEIGKKWDKRRKLAVKRKLVSEYPYINDFSVSQNFLNGRLEIEGKIEKFVSKIKFNGAKKYYLARSGKIYSFEHHISSVNFIDTEVYADEKIQLKDFAEFADEINSNKNLFGLAPVLVKYRASERKCVIVLEDGSRVNWGEFELTDLKILRLNGVLSDVSGKMEPPYKINLEYFASGKVFVSKLGVGEK